MSIVGLIDYLSKYYDNRTIPNVGLVYLGEKQIVTIVMINELAYMTINGDSNKLNGIQVGNIFSIEEIARMHYDFANK